VSLKFGLGMADAIIYATAKKERAKLVTSDVHFKGLKDVEFIDNAIGTRSRQGYEIGSRYAECFEMVRLLGEI